MADPALDDSDWESVPVPGHWRAAGAFADSDGPIAYRRRFEAPAPEADRRAFLTFDGIFYQADVWLDGDYLWDTEGYFFPHTFEVTGPLAAQPEHTLAVEVTCARPDDPARKRNLTGVFQHWDCIDRDWNPGGIWAPVRLHHTGQVWIRSLKVLCRDATAESATLDFEAELDTPVAQRVTVITRVAREGREPGTAATGTDTHALALGRTIVRWRVAVDEPELWWPHSLGEQPLYDVSVEVLAGDEAQPSDSRSLTTGLRQVRLRNFIATVNGERIFLKGANYGPAKRALDHSIAAVKGKGSLGLTRCMAYHPEIQHAIAEMVIELESIGPHLESVAHDWSIRVDHGAQWPSKIFAAKYRAVEGSWRVVDRGLDVAGGNGIFRSAGYERLVRDARLGRIHPANSFLTHEVVAKTALGISLDESPRWG